MSIETREAFELWIVVIVSIVFALISSNLGFVDRLYRRFESYGDFPVAEFLVHVVFLFLLGLLWISYRRWQSAKKKQVELGKIMEVMSPAVSGPKSDKEVLENLGLEVADSTS
jgi:hypothetical protein